VGILARGEHLEADRPAVPDGPEVPDPDLDLDAADSTSGPLAHRNRNVIAVLVELLRLDHELIEDLQLSVDCPPDLVGSAMGAAEQTLLGLEPFEVLIEKCEPRLIVALVHRPVERPDRHGWRFRIAEPAQLDHSACGALIAQPRTAVMNSATYGLCTIPDDAAAVREARRVLRPGGKLLLAEHVRSPNPVVRTIQRLIDPLAHRFGGDHLLREPLGRLDAEGFRVEQLRRSKAGFVELVAARKPA
jgi:SAM-dependent methyltransferase